MEEYFTLKYEFDKKKVDEAIERRLQSPGADYICVSDGVVLDQVFQHPDYRDIINGGMFSVCDSGYVPLYIRMIYGLRREQYCGHELFLHQVGRKRFRMMFLGSSDRILEPLKEKLTEIDPKIADMKFIELPFLPVEEFDYEGIAEEINEDRPDIIWISLGAPKQEQFMHRLKPHLKHGVIISVGAVFKFISGVGARRAPRWMVKMHIEFVHRIMMEPRKQLRRTFSIITTLPKIIRAEIKRKKQRRSNQKNGLDS